MATLAEQRRFVRLPFETTVACSDGPRVQRVGTSTDIGRGGFCIRLGNALAPGQNVLLSFPEVDTEEGKPEFKARVVWSRPLTPGAFEVGCRVYHDEMVTDVFASELLYAAVLGQEAQRRPIWQMQAVGAEFGSGMSVLAAC